MVMLEEKGGVIITQALFSFILRCTALFGHLRFFEKWNLPNCQGKQLESWKVPGREKPTFGNSYSISPWRELIRCGLPSHSFPK